MLLSTDQKYLHDIHKIKFEYKLLSGSPRLQKLMNARSAAQNLCHTLYYSFLKLTDYNIDNERTQQ